VTRTGAPTPSAASGAGRPAGLRRPTGRLGLLRPGVVAFVAGLVVGHVPGWWSRRVVGSPVLGSALLLPAIIVGFGVTAAEREDRG